MLNAEVLMLDRKSTRLNSSHTIISYAVFCLKKKKNKINDRKAREPPTEVDARATTTLHVMLLGRDRVGPRLHHVPLFLLSGFFFFFKGARPPRNPPLSPPRPLPV